MGRLHRIWLLVITGLLLLCTQNVRADEEKLLFSDSLHLTVEHRKYRRIDNINDQRITDKFLEAFSKSIPRILAYTKFSIHWQQDIYLSGNKLVTQIKGIHIRGYEHYRGFPVEKQMIPSKIAYSIFLEAAGKQAVINDTIDLSHDRKVIPLADSLSEYNLQFNDISYTLMYTEEQSEAFQRKTEAIDQYYLDFPLLKEALIKVGGITIGNLNMLPIYSANLREAEAILDQLQESDYLQILDLEKNDPLKFLPRFKNLKSGIAFKRAKINRQMQNLERLYYQEGLSYLSTDTAISRGYFEKSIQANPYFSPAWLELARLDLQQGRLDASAGKTEHLLMELKPDTQTYQQAILFSDTLVAAFISKARELMAEEEFNWAIEIMERAAAFCRNTPRYKCSPEVQKYLSKARYGIYNAYVAVARQALNANRPDLALQYIKMVDRFQKEHSSSIISDRAIKLLYDEVAELFVEQAGHLIENKDYEQAFSHYDNAAELCRTEDCRNMIRKHAIEAHQGVYDQKVKKAASEYRDENYHKADELFSEAENYRKKHQLHVNRTEKAAELQEKIDKEIYLLHLQKGFAFLNYERFEIALKEFTDARKLLKHYQFGTNDTLDSLTRRAAEPLVLAEIKRADMKVWGARFSNANDILEEVKEDTAEYNLGNSKIIQLKIQELSHKLQAKVCEAARDTFRHHSEKGSLGITSTDYLSARTHYRRALQIARRYAFCKFDTLKAANKLEQYRHIFRFAELHKSVDSLYKNNNITALITKLESAEHFFKQHKLSDEGLVVLSPLTFAKRQGDDELKLKFIRYYLKQQDGRKALELLKSLRNSQVDYSIIKNLQKKTGRILAKKDAGRKGSINYKKQAIRYSDNDYWLRHLEQSYKSAYRKAEGIFPWFF